MMNRLFFLIILFLCGCTSLNKVDSTQEANNNPNEYNYSDVGSKIRYQITNDEKNLHIRLNAREFTTITKILRTGLKICFDVKGKKSDKVYFQYPLPADQQFLGRDNSNKSKGGYGQSSRFDLNKLVSQISNEAVFCRNGNIERISLRSTDADVKASIRAINNAEIVYDLIIPLNRISREGLTSLSKLSMGFVSGNIEIPSMGGRSEGASGEGRSGGMSVGGRSGGMSGGGRSGGMSGGGRSGGMSGGGRSGGMAGGGRSGGMDRSSMTDPIKIWFKLDLH